MVFFPFKRVFRLRSEEYITQLCWDSNDSLWARTGRQKLFKFDYGRDIRHTVEDTCRHFSIDGKCIAYVTGSDQVIVRSTSDLSEVGSLQFNTRIHAVCLKGKAVVIASNQGLFAWNFEQNICKTVNPLHIVAWDICCFGADDRFINAEYDLYSADLRSGELDLLQSRVYDLEYPFYSVSTFMNEYLCVSGSSVEIFDVELNLIASSQTVRAVESVFIDASTLVVREGGCQSESARREEEIVYSTSPDRSDFRVFIAANMAALAFNNKTKQLAIAGHGSLTVEQPAV